MEKINWQLPTVQSNVTNNDYIRHNAKLHCYVNNISLCKKHIQQTDAFEDYDINDFLKEHGKDYVCKVCLEKYLKMVNNKNNSR